MPIMRGITLRSGTIGDLESLCWLEKAEPAEPGILVTVIILGTINFGYKILNHTSYNNKVFIIIIFCHNVIK